jgi:hypothetical protein
METFFSESNPVSTQDFILLWESRHVGLLMPIAHIQI